MWYEEKTICFACTGCGACCKREDGEVYITDQELDAIERFLKANGRSFPGTHLQREHDGLWSLPIPEGGSCPFLDAQNLCSIQEVKPWQCSAYPFWPEVMHSEQAWQEEARFCEGMNQGEAHSVEAIEESLRGDPFLE
tara:strand:- start:36 stop:449 length:414 start_codon:yes stop_codon:yes gene_type:complete